LIIPFFVIPAIQPGALAHTGSFCIGYFVALWYYLKSMAPVTDEVRQTFGEMNTHLPKCWMVWRS
jgi:hypothetical protein